MWISEEKPLKESRDLICTVCPLGCQIAVRQDVLAVRFDGHSCARGEGYARRELTDPRRVVTTTVRIQNGIIRRLPVRTSAPFPLRLIPELMQTVKSLEVVAPIQRGAVIVRNLLAQDIDLLATRTVPEILSDTL
ncbi:MAG TPA: DUF1667 domain-containing protein [Atribacteraceae bacterium]|nr:DUF1667 domain-containing protein [Atribacteraceae bacterium]